MPIHKYTELLYPELLLEIELREGRIELRYNEDRSIYATLRYRGGSLKSECTNPRADEAWLDFRAQCLGIGISDYAVPFIKL